MTKPKILIIDWKEKYTYKYLNDIADVEIKRQIPDSLDGLQAIVVHLSGTLHPSTIRDVLKKAEDEKVPVLVEGLPEAVFKALPNHYKVDGSNLHYVGPTNKLYDAVLKILGE